MFLSWSVRSLPLPKVGKELTKNKLAAPGRWEVLIILHFECCTGAYCLLAKSQRQRWVRSLCGCYRGCSSLVAILFHRQDKNTDKKAHINQRGEEKSSYKYELMLFLTGFSMQSVQFLWALTGFVLQQSELKELHPYHHLYLLCKVCP